MGSCEGTLLGRNVGDLGDNEGTAVGFTVGLEGATVGLKSN